MNDLSFAFKLPPEKAIAYFKSKGYAFSWDWWDTWEKAHAKAFTVAKAMRMDVLQDIRDMVSKALDEGITFAQFRKELEPRLKAKGWWGRKIVGDGAGAKTVQLGSPYRLQTIFRANTQTAFMAGRYRALMENTGDRPYWQYVAVLDSRTRPSHRRLHGKIFRYDDPFWESFFPPNGWNCRCRVRALSAKDMQERSLSAESSEDCLSTEEAIINAAGDRRPVTVYTDPNTKLTVHPDPGWSYNPGEVGWKPDLAKYDPPIRKLYGKEDFDTSNLKAIPGTQKGSNPGGLYEDQAGKRYYVKFYKKPDQARSEWAAAELYREMEMEAPALRLAKMAGPGGKKQLALISEWQDDLRRLTPQEMLAHKKDLAEAYHAAVLVKNWDVVGLNFDNLVLTSNKRLMVVDSGGSFRFRARGGTKPYGADIAEVKTLRDAAKNPQTAQVFNGLFGQDVFAEGEGSKVVLGLTRERVDAIFADAGFTKKAAKDLGDVLMARRDLIIDRYNLNGSYSYKGFGKHLERFREWGTEQWRPNVVGGLTYGSTEPGWGENVLGLVKQFEEYINTTIHPYARGVLRGLFSEWSGNSSASGGATIKLWVKDRFGISTNYHGYRTTAREIETALVDNLEESLKRAKLPKEKVFEILDAEYEFHQYYLRRLHGYDECRVLRYMRQDEFTQCFSEGIYKGNSAYSTTVRRGGFSNQKLIEMSHRVEDVLKTYHQGVKYMHYGSREAEYVMIGRNIAAKVLK